MFVLLPQAFTMTLTMAAFYVGCTRAQPSNLLLLVKRTRTVKQYPMLSVAAPHGYNVNTLCLLQMPQVHRYSVASSPSISKNGALEHSLLLP
jgi:hypothetical protein